MIAKQICANRCTLCFACVSYTLYGTCKLRNRMMQKNIKQKCCYISHVPRTHLVLPWSIPLQTWSMSDHLVPYYYFPSYKYWFPLIWMIVIKYFSQRNECFCFHHDLSHLRKCFRQEIFCSLFDANLTSVVLVGKCTWFLTRAFQNVTVLICWIMKSKLFHKKRCNYTACNTQINWLNVTL